MATLALSTADFTFGNEEHSGNELRVYSFTGHEELSRPFVFQIVLTSDLPDIDLEGPVGKAAWLALRGRDPDGVPYTRHVHGVVERFEQRSAGKHHSRYEATLVPTLLPLKYTRNSRVFQKMKTVDIAKQVLKDGGVPADWVNTLLHDKYEPRDYCVQYQESDLDFISRLLEEEGIFYYFEHSKDRDVLVFGDGDHAIDTVPNAAALNYRDHPHLYEEGFYELRAQTALRPGTTILRDFRFKQPGLDMEAQKSAGPFGQYKMFYFPGEYVDQALGQRLVKVRMAELSADRLRFLSAGNSRALLPGYKFSLKLHGRSDFNQDYLIVAVEHECSQPQALREELVEGAKVMRAYENRLVCIPAGVAYRPPRTTPRPSIAGIQSAIVVGPGGEEIHCDEFGRVKVQFHWDREGKKDDSSSCWVRVSQPWGGSGSGGMFIPRIGQEVLVQFLEGDPDRPVIVGRVYNGEQTVPHPLPANKHISTIRSASTPGGGGFNEIKLDDTAGNELLFVHSQFNCTEVVGNNHDLTVTVDQSESVGNDRSASVGNNETLKVGVDQNVNIGANQTQSIGANQTETIGADQTASIGANQTATIGANQTVSIGSSQTITVGLNKTETVAINFAETVGAAMELTIGAAFVETVGAVKTSTIGGALIESVGSSHSEQVGGALSIVVGKGATMKAAQGIGVQAGQGIGLQAGKEIASKAGKEITLDAGTKVTIVAADEISLKAGSATLVLKKNGDILLKGNKITVKGSGDVVIKGSKIAQN